MIELATSGDIWHLWGPNLWENYGRLSGYTFAGRPDIVSIKPGRMDMYTQLTGSQFLAHKKVDVTGGMPWEKIGSAGTVTPLPFTPGSSPGVTSGGPYPATFPYGIADEIDVVILDNASPQKNLWWGLSQNGTSFTWTNCGHPAGFTFLTGDPDLSASIPGGVDFFVTDTDGAVLHGWVSDTGGGNFQPSPFQWDPYSVDSPPGLFATTGVSAVAMGDARIMISVAANNNQIWNRLYDYGWNPWYLVPNNWLHRRPDLGAW